MKNRLGLMAIGLSAILLIAGANDSSNRQDPILSQWQLTTVDKMVLDKIAANYEIVARKKNTYEIIVAEGQVETFRQIAPNAKLITSDLRAALLGLQEIDPTWLADYRSFSEVEAQLAAYAQQFPELVSLETYGESAGGRPLYALKLSDNVAIDEDEPELMLTSATHGDELITVEVLMNLLDELIAGYGTDERLTAMIDDHEIWILPVINPDGFTRQSRYANGTDPNRDYPWPDSPNRTSVPCIAHVIDFFHAHNIVGSLDFHASGKMVMWPWAYTYDRPEPNDNLALSNLGNLMAEDNQYDAGQISRIIYVARGSSADYYHWQNRSLSYGIELARSKVPHPNDIPNVVTEAREMTWKFIEAF